MHQTSPSSPRQDHVDNAIFELLQSLNPTKKPIEWNIEMIGEIRDVASNGLSIGWTSVQNKNSILSLERMSGFDQQKEWDFICSEATHLHQTNKTTLTRELLFTVQNLLSLYSAAEEDFRKSFLASIYLQTKAKYLQGTWSLHLQFTHPLPTITPITILQ